MTLTINISEVLTTYVLNEGEKFNLYLKKPDGYNAFGYVGAYDDPDTVAELIANAVNDPELLGVWVTIESGNGAVDFTVFHIERRMKP